MSTPEVPSTAPQDRDGEPAPCVHVQVPEIACYVRFGPQVLETRKRSTRELGTTCRGEWMIADLDDEGRICGIELVGGKPCQGVDGALPMDKADPHTAAPIVPISPEPLIAYMNAETTPERDVAYLRLYAEKIRNKSETLWEIPNTRAATVENIATRFEAAYKALTAGDSEKG